MDWMKTGVTAETWDYLILDADIRSEDMNSLCLADINGDGVQEIIVGGHNILLWYHIKTRRKFVIAEGNFSVGLAACDLDDDGRIEIVTSELDEKVSSKWMINWYKPGDDIEKPWDRQVIDSRCGGLAHDILLADIDGDGENELVANAVFGSPKGIYIYKRQADIRASWNKFAVIEGLNTEGLSAGDLNGDHKLEIICGIDYYIAPEAGPYEGFWKRSTYAHNFRELCRTALFDITGNGRPDIIVTDSEYMDGSLSWFENRFCEDPENPLVEHRLEEGLVYSHSLTVSYDDVKKEVQVFVAEMEQGGWRAPYNHDARLLVFSSSDRGGTWKRSCLYKGEGSHQAILSDIDGSGETRVIGKTYGHYWHNSKIQLWERAKNQSPLREYRHKFIDRDKPYTATDILAADVDGDGTDDVVCGKWWYRNAAWERYEIPFVCQVINAYDIDGDGRMEFIGIRESPGASGYFYNQLSCDMCWLKPVDPVNGVWEHYPIGTGHGDWPHGSLIAPLLPGNRLALVLGYHNAAEGKYPEIFEIPDEPESGIWKKRILAEIPYGEKLLACDIDGDGKLDIVAGAVWLENLGNGEFAPHTIIEGFKAASAAIADITGNGKPDVILGEEAYDSKKRVTPYSRLVWCENPADPRKDSWNIHAIDSVRWAHSLSTGDIDGDGEAEIVCGEHDPTWPYRTRCNLFVYKKADPEGKSWKKMVLDNRFEHHCGAKVVELTPGQTSIISHGWVDSIYVNVWEL